MHDLTSMWQIIQHGRDMHWWMYMFCDAVVGNLVAMEVTGVVVDAYSRPFIGWYQWSVDLRSLQMDCLQRDTWEVPMNAEATP